MPFNQLAANKCFAGQQLRFRHLSQVLGCDMTFSLYMPPQAQQRQVPLLLWLSGLTCTDENFVQKAGAQRYAAHHGIAILCPDTSPRGENVPDDPDGAWDFGQGAGFYLNATQTPWDQHYHMEQYLIDELLPQVIHNFPISPERVGISGHSMGGHGALTLGLNYPARFRSISAFAPICAPSQVPWGKKAFSRYLGEDSSTWLRYDACELIRQHTSPPPLLVDQGTTDQFLVEQLKPDLLQQACSDHDVPLQLRMHPGYDHSYFFIATFIEDHILFHCERLLES
ncbi:S-formylglutathione hydrolase [Pelobacter seleniigenes]|uniref:S-formylglutathione hydrolase n=1 Tax=Pelobacter seleniigenes TaxID=407188 RepID=UPI0004A7023F|nr:S-formylglutathione hydrolase [Pelobacter seleniigenes]